MPRPLQPSTSDGTVFCARCRALPPAGAPVYLAWPNLYCAQCAGASLPSRVHVSASRVPSPDPASLACQACGTPLAGAWAVTTWQDPPSGPPARDRVAGTGDSASRTVCQACAAPEVRQAISAHEAEAPGAGTGTAG